MEEKRRALICIGDRPRNIQSLEFTRKVIQAYDYLPVLFHALAQGSPTQKAEQLLTSANEVLKFENAEFLSVAGVPRKEIERELKRREYRLVVLGTSERDPALTPSPLCQYLANRLRTSVLLIRNPPDEICQILICTAGHRESENAIDWGLHLAEKTNNKVTILHVVSSPPTMYTGLNEVEEKLTEVLARDVPLTQHLKAVASKAEEIGVDAKLELRRGLVIEEIIRSAEIEAHDLVVLGAPPHQAILKQILLGRVGPKVLASTYRSTLIVRGPMK
jgi:nucleotide-binding universal stress UspA family protein